MTLLCLYIGVAVLVRVETVNREQRSVRGLGFDAQRASGGAHTLLYTDGAANVCQSGGALTDSDLTLPNHTADDGEAAPSLSRTSTAAGAPTEGMCHTGAAQ